MSICLNGPAARKASVGDKIIIISYAIMNEKEAELFKPTILLVNDNNNIK